MVEEKYIERNNPFSNEVTFDKLKKDGIRPIKEVFMKGSEGVYWVTWGVPAIILTVNIISICRSDGTDPPCLPRDTNGVLSPRLPLPGASAGKNSCRM